MPHAVTDFSACGASETVSRAISFAPALASGETLASASCTITVSSGTDAAPQSRLAAGPTIAGSSVGLLFSGGLAGVVYQILIVAATSAGQTLECYALQPVLAL